jgi:hypothetical protein
MLSGLNGPDWIISEIRQFHGFSCVRTGQCGIRKADWWTLSSSIPRAKMKNMEALRQLRDEAGQKWRNSCWS